MFLFINLNQRPRCEFVMNELRPKQPPFGIAYIAAVLKTIGISSVLHDDNLHEYSEQQLRELLRKYKGVIQAVGLTSVSTTLSQLSRVSRIAKEELPDTPVIVGGPHARLLPDDIISLPTVDVVFTSEAEMSIADYAKGKELSEIGGVCFKKDNDIVRNPFGNIVSNIDDIPFPAYDLFNIADYHTTKGIAKRHPASYIITSRGCPYDCTFCSSKALNQTSGKKIRFRSPENVVEEIEWLFKSHGVRELFFSDDMFTGNMRHLAGICEGLIKRNLDVIWVCMTHVNNINAEKLKLMKRAGCHQVCFGVESGDPYIQKVTNKNLDLEKVRAVVRMTQEIGIDVRCSFMFGNQYETPDTMQHTIDFALSLKPEFASFNIATPFPGTYLRSWAIENGYLADSSYESLDSTKYTIVTDDLPPGTVERYCNKAIKSFYYNPRYILRRIRKIRNMDEMVRVAKSAFYACKTLPVFVRSIWGKNH